MFWKKPQSPRHEGESPNVAPPAPSLPPARDLSKAAAELAASLNAYADAAHEASKLEPDSELIAARKKVAVARKLVREGPLADALGSCIPEHVKYWPAWSQHDSFQSWVHFDASDIQAHKHEEEDGSRKVQVYVIHFTFNCSRYRLVLRDRGMSPVPDSADRLGDVELWLDDQLVAKFELIQDFDSYWRFSDVRALKVGPWMKDMIDIATQIEAWRRSYSEDIINKRDLEAAKNIDLG
jgi:hypothetical protein